MYAPPPAQFLPTPVGAPAWSGYAGQVRCSPPAATFLPPAAPPPPPKACIKLEPALLRQGKEPPFLSQQQHIYLTGPGYNAVQAGEVCTPPCSCGAKHGPLYKLGPHATWDCPLRYLARYGSCPGFLSGGMKDPAQWLGDHLTPLAKLAWILLITDLNLPLAHGSGGRAPNFSI
jgi:hypothetical protein